MSDTNSKINFHKVVMGAIGTTRECNDGSGCDSFTISHDDVKGIVDNLDMWWHEKFEDFECTLEQAQEYFDDVYPEA
jgi:hypothetical protein